MRLAKNTAGGGGEPPKRALRLKIASKIQVEKLLLPPGLLCHLILQTVYIISGELGRL